MHDVQSSIGNTMEYSVIRKGRGTVYACLSMLYRQVEKEGDTSYLKCCINVTDTILLHHSTVTINTFLLSKIIHVKSLHHCPLLQCPPLRLPPSMSTPDISVHTDSNLWDYLALARTRWRWLELFLRQQNKQYLALSAISVLTISTFERVIAGRSESRQVRESSDKSELVAAITISRRATQRTAQRMWKRRFSI